MNNLGAPYCAGAAPVEPNGDETCVPNGDDACVPKGVVDERPPACDPNGELLEGAAAKGDGDGAMPLGADGGLPANGELTGADAAPKGV